MNMIHYFKVEKIHCVFLEVVDILDFDNIYGLNFEIYLFQTHIFES